MFPNHDGVPDCRGTFEAQCDCELDSPGMMSEHPVEFQLKCWKEWALYLKRRIETHYRPTLAKAEWERDFEHALRELLDEAYWLALDENLNNYNRDVGRPAVQRAWKAEWLYDEAIAHLATQTALVPGKDMDYWRGVIESDWKHQHEYQHE